MKKTPPPIAVETPPPPEKRVKFSEITLIGKKAVYLLIEIKAANYQRRICLN